MQICRRKQVLDVEVKCNGVDGGMHDVQCQWKLNYGARLFSGVADGRNGFGRVIGGDWEEMNVESN
jgi:hypothetical protein